MLLMVKPDDVNAFASAIGRLATDKNLREEMKGACLQAVEPFEMSNALKSMWDIYREILL